MKTTLVPVLLAVSVLALGCGGDDDSGGLPDGDALVMAVGSDYVGSSVFSQVVLPQVFVDEASIDGVASLDPVIRVRGSYVIVINRAGFDNVTVLDLADRSLVAQVSTGAGSNPQDVALSGDGKLYVADAGGQGLSVIDMNDPEAGATAIDLSSLDPDDGVPNCHAVEFVFSQVFVSCGVRDDNDDFLTPRGNGVIAIVDPATDTLVDSFELEHSSPTGFFVNNPGAQPLLYIATVPDFFAPGSDGCIEVIDATGDPESDGCLIENQTLGGYVADMSATPSGIFAAVVTGFDENDFGAVGTAVDIDLSGTTVEPFTDSSVRAFDVAACPGGERVVADATSGLRFYSADGIELSSEAVDIGAPVIGAGTECIGLAATTRL